jgi:hypothetical protein
MQTLGINYDTGVVVGGTSTRADFDDGRVRRELEIIAGDLHANAVRVTGDRVDRLEAAARHASAAGMQVWFSPFLSDLGPDELVERLAGIAERAERLRRAGVDIVLVLGGEISLFCWEPFDVVSVDAYRDARNAPGFADLVGSYRRFGSRSPWPSSAAAPTAAPPTAAAPAGWWSTSARERSPARLFDTLAARYAAAVPHAG